MADKESIEYREGYEAAFVSGWGYFDEDESKRPYQDDAKKWKDWDDGYMTGLEMAGYIC